MTVSSASSMTAASPDGCYDPMWEFDCPKYRDFRSMSGQRAAGAASLLPSDAEQRSSDDDDEAADAWFDRRPAPEHHKENSSSTKAGRRSEHSSSVSRQRRSAAPVPATQPPRTRPSTQPQPAVHPGRPSVRPQTGPAALSAAPIPTPAAVPTAPAPVIAAPAPSRPSQHARHSSHPVLSSPLSISAPSSCSSSASSSYSLHPPRSHRVLHQSDSALLPLSTHSGSSSSTSLPAAAASGTVQPAVVTATAISSSSSALSVSAPVCRPSVTVPRSPNLSTSCRVAARTSIRANLLSREEEELQRMEAERESIRRRIAANGRMVEKLFSLPPQPPPTLRATTTVRSQTALTRPAALALHTANRVQERQERGKAEAKRRPAAADSCVIHALPLPHFDAVFVPSKSSQPLTTPRSPPLLTAKRATVRASTQQQQTATAATTTAGGGGGAAATATQSSSQRLTKREWR